MPNPAAALILLVAILALPQPANAQSGPFGIGFAQAEEGTWWCRDEDPAKTLACALDKCAKESNGQGCHPTRWCSPAGWSGLMIAWLPEFHNTLVLCGMPGEPALTDAFKAICDRTPEFTRCDLVTIVDPDGNERSVDGANWPGPAITETEADAPGTPQAPQ